MLSSGKSNPPLRASFIKNEVVFSQAKTAEILPWRGVYDKILLTDGRAIYFIKQRLNI